VKARSVMIKDIHYVKEGDSIFIVDFENTGEVQFNS
jgi:hypothetical protein